MPFGTPDLNTWESAQRSSGFSRDHELEEALAALNRRLAAGALSADPPPISDRPVVFLVGCARSGSTLLFQWLAASGGFCYPTNIISRFYADPYVGALVHRVLHDLDRNGEVFPVKAAMTFRSDLGRAKGANEPHDFGYFWKSHFTFGAHQGELIAPDRNGPHTRMVTALRSMQAVFDRPLVIKALQMNWHLDILLRCFPRCLVLYTDRDPYDNALSLLAARRRYFGDEGKWYSFRPPEYSTIKDLSPMEQCLAQVHHTNAAVRRQLHDLAKGRALRVDYEELCREPEAVHVRIMDALGSDMAYNGVASFPFRSQEDPLERARANAFLESLAGE